MMSSSEPKFSHASGFSSPVGTRRRFFEWVIKAAAGFVVSQDDRSDRKRLFLLVSEPGVKKKVHNGGSFLCTDQYCARYIAGSRGKGEPDMGTNHLGFRLVRDAR